MGVQSTKSTKQSSPLKDSVEYSTAVQFKENTGFCVNCRQWKLLVKHLGKSLYCVKCSETHEGPLACPTDDESEIYEGPWVEQQKERIARHRERVEGELAKLEGKDVLEITAGRKAS